MQRHENQQIGIGASAIKRDNGARGSRILFSCTWKLARKKLNDVPAEPHNSALKCSFSFLPCIPTLNSNAQNGIIITRVKIKAKMGCISIGMRSRMEIGLIDKRHQMFDTFPSKRPLPKGKILERIGFITSDTEFAFSERK